MRASVVGRAPDGEAEPGNGGCLACGKPFLRPDSGNWGIMLNQGSFCWRKDGISRGMPRSV